MLGIHRQHPHAAPAGLVHDDFPRHHQDPLAGDGDVLARADGGERGLQAGGADDGDEDNVSLGQGGEAHEAVGARVDLDAGAEGVLQFAGLRGISNGDRGGLVLQGLLEEQLGVAARREADEAQAVR